MVLLSTTSGFKPYNLKRLSAQLVSLVGLFILSLLFCSPSFAQQIIGSAVGAGNQTATDTGVAINGAANGSNINSNQNTLLNGGNDVRVGNSNTNLVQPVTLAPSSANGGTSALVLPRNPLHIPNAVLGRKNFGLQFGVQNNPALSALSGNSNALGWFMQAGVNIPFGKIPEPYQDKSTQAQLNNRLESINRERDVFGRANVPHPRNSVRGRAAHTDVRGQVLQRGLSAYSPSSVSAGKISTDELQLPLLQASRPHILALNVAKVYSRPLDMGDRLAMLEAGQEYIYLGHTQSGWVKLLLPTGKPGWSKGPFEYIKSDYTELDTFSEQSDTNLVASDAKNAAQAEQKQGTAEQTQVKKTLNKTASKPENKTLKEG